MEGIIYYDRTINEMGLFFGDSHENQIAKELDSITLDKPILLVCHNYDGPETYYAVEMTQKTLDFLKEHRDWDYDYEIYFNYRFEEKPFDTIYDIEENSSLLDFTYLSEKDFESKELKEWGEFLGWKENSSSQGIINFFLEEVADYHNQKFHDGKKYWEVNNGDIVHKED